MKKLGQTSLAVAALTWLATAPENRRYSSHKEPNANAAKLPASSNLARKLFYGGNCGFSVTPLPSVAFIVVMVA